MASCVEDEKVWLVDSPQKRAASSARRLWEVLQAALVAHTAVLVCTGLSVSGTVMVIVFLRKTGQAMSLFPFFTFWGSAPVFCLAFGSCLVGGLWSGQVRRDTCDIPLRQLAMMGLLGSLNSTLIFFANPKVPGNLQALLGPTVLMIPLTMVVTMLLLGRRYSRAHGGAAAIVMCGVLLSLVPHLRHPSSPQHTSLPAVFWDVMYLCGSVPLALMTVLEEKVFRADAQASALYLITGLTGFQTLFMVLIAPVDVVPEVGTATPRTFWPHQKEALWCLAGHYSESCGDACECDVALPMFILFVVGYVVGNLGNLGLVKYGNAALVFVVVSLATPLAEVCFASSVIMAPFPPDEFDVFTLIAIPIVVLGVMLYGWVDVRRATKETKATESRRVDRPL